jgi:hypothetical protein
MQLLTGLCNQAACECTIWGYRGEKLRGQQHPMAPIRSRPRTMRVKLA